MSIGIVAEDGRNFYAELTDYDKTQVDDWIKEHVVDNFVMGDIVPGEQEYYIASRDASNPIGNDIYNNYSVHLQGDKIKIQLELIRWLNQFSTIEYISDVCHYDFVLFIDLVYNHALNIPYKKHGASCHDINQDIARYYQISDMDAFDRSRESILSDFDVKIEGRKHNALYDAKVIKEIYQLMNN